MEEDIGLRHIDPLLSPLSAYRAPRPRTCRRWQRPLLLTLLGPYETNAITTARSLGLGTLDARRNSAVTRDLAIYGGC